MNQLAEYYSDDESPLYRRHSNEEPHPEKTDEEQTSSKKRKDVVRKEKRRNSEYWTGKDESADESSSSSTRSSSESGSGKSGSESSRPPPSKKPSPSASGRSVQSDFGGMPSLSRQHNRPLASKSEIAVTQSQTSLVSYGAEAEEEDQFAEADRKAVAIKEAEKKGSSESTNREPKPPRGHQDSRSPDEIAVDGVAEESLREFDTHRPEHSFVEALRVASMTPKSMEGSDSPLIHDEPVEIRMPPSPIAKCSPELEARFRGFFERKAQGADLNAMIQKRRDFKNPSMYEKLIEKFEVDELGSNFPPSVFDPHGFTKDCFYDYISMLQKEAMEKYNAALEKKQASAVASISGKAVEAKRKSRFEHPKK